MTSKRFALAAAVGAGLLGLSTPALAAAPSTVTHELPQSQCTYGPAGATSVSGPNFVLHPHVPYLFHCYQGEGGLGVNVAGMTSFSTGNYAAYVLYNNSSGRHQSPVLGPHKSYSFGSSVTVVEIITR